MQKKIKLCKSGQKYILDIFYTDYVYFYVNTNNRNIDMSSGYLVSYALQSLRIQHYFRYSTIVDSTIVFHELLRSDLSFQGLFLLSPYPHDFGS